MNRNWDYLNMTQSTNIHPSKSWTKCNILHHYKYVITIMLQFIIFARDRRAAMEGLAQILKKHINVAAGSFTLDRHAPVSINIPVYTLSKLF